MADSPEPDPGDDGTEPDPRFTFANERTFLAWSRTALALVVAGLGVVQLLPPFPGVPWGPSPSRWSPWSCRFTASSGRGHPRPSGVTKPSS